MKIHIIFPGGSIDIERAPLDKDKFNVLCMLAGGAMFWSFWLILFTR